MYRKKRKRVLISILKNITGRESESSLSY